MYYKLEDINLIEEKERKRNYMKKKFRLTVITDLEGIWIKNDKKSYIELTDKFFLEKNISLKIVERVDKFIFPKILKAGRRGEISYKKVIEKYFKEISPRNYKKLSREFINFENRIIKRYMKLCKNAKAVLSKLKQYPVFLICLSDTMYSIKKLRAILKTLGINEMFDKVYTSNYLKCEKPEAFKKLKLNINKKPVFIGHDQDELQGAKKYGFITVGLNSKADYVINSITEIPKIIEGLIE